MRLLLLVLFNAYTLIYAQNVELDSLQNLLKTHEEKDTTRVDLLNAIAGIVYKTDLEKGINLIEKANTLADELNYQSGKAKNLITYGYLEIYKSDFKQAFKKFEKASILYQTIGDKEGVSNCYRGIARTHKAQNNFQEAIEYYLKSLKINEEIKNERLTSLTLLGIGNCYSELGDYTNALEYYQKSFQIRKKIGKKSDIAFSLNNIGVVHGRQSNYSSAIENFYQALEIFEQLGDIESVASCLNNIAIMYELQENYDKSLEYSKKALHIDEKQKNRKGIILSLNHIGTIYKKQGKIKDALEYLNEALKISKEIKDELSISICLHSIGEAQEFKKEYLPALQNYQQALEIGLKIGDQLGICESHIGLSSVYYIQKAYDQSLHHAIKGQEIAKNLEILDLQKDASELLAKIYYDTKKYKEGYNNYVAFKMLSDSIFNKSNLQKIAQLESEYVYKERLNSAEKKEITLHNKIDVEKKEKWLWITGFALAAIMLGLTLLFLRVKRLESEKQYILIEQRLLRSQMNPHFMFNTLAAIKTQIKENQKTGLDYLTKFSKHVRLILENSLHDYVLIAKELEALRKYMDLELHRFPNSFTYSFNLVNIKEDDFIFIPPMLLQPFIENSIKHGFLNIDYQGEVNILLKKRDSKFIHCEIKDNGSGMTKPQEGSKDSLSTKLITSFIEKRTQSTVKITNRLDENKKNKGTVISFLIPYNTTGYD
ncbi:MAG: tetratricopeptide repeat protein [Saprospiraceae bacterium]